MRILLTGGTGFIGKHTHSKLKDRGHEVSLFKGDVRKVGDWKKNLEKEVDVVIHSAAVRTETKKDFEVNIKGTENFFKAVSKPSQKPKKFILASSQAVYIGCKPPFKEDVSVRPLTVYGKSKFRAEKVVRKYGKKLGIRVIILRYSTVLGTGVRKGSGMSGPLYIWTEAALNGKNIEVFQDGKQTRDYIHVVDVVAANLLAVEKDIQGVFNVGGGREIKLISLAKMVKEATGAKSKIVITEKYIQTDPRHCLSNIAKLKNLGWKPKKTTKEAVEEFVKEFKK